MPLRAPRAPANSGKVRAETEPRERAPLRALLLAERAWARRAHLPHRSLATCGPGASLRGSMAAVFQERTAEAGAALLQLLQLVTEAAKAEEELRNQIPATVAPFGSGFKDDSWVERRAPVLERPLSRDFPRAVRWELAAVSRGAALPARRPLHRSRREEKRNTSAGVRRQKHTSNSQPAPRPSAGASRPPRRTRRWSLSSPKSPRPTPSAPAAPRPCPTERRATAAAASLSYLPPAALPAPRPTPRPSAAAL